MVRQDSRSGEADEGGGDLLQDGNSRLGNTPACAVISHISPTTRNGNAVRAITRNRLSPSSADVPGEDLCDTAGARSDISAR